MMVPGFKPVGWVAAVSVAAIGCYMLSLNVAAERAELARVEHQIIATKQQIRALHTELGTRGRLAQLEEWNAEVLALSAPTSAQFLGDEMMLARFDRSAPSIEERAAIRMASAETGPVVDQRAAETPVIHAAAPAAVSPRATAPLASPQLVRKASLELPAATAPGQSSASLRGQQKPVTASTRHDAKPAPPKSAPPKPLLRAAAGTGASPMKPAAKSPAGDKPVVLASARSATLKPLPRPAAASVSARDLDKPKAGGRIGDNLAREIGAAAKAEARAGGP